jgi:hypothetical protein
VAAVVAVEVAMEGLNDVTSASTNRFTPTMAMFAPKFITLFKFTPPILFL